MDGRYIAFSRLVEVRKHGRRLSLGDFKFDLLPDGNGKYRVSHWLERIGLGWVIPLPVDLDDIRVSFPGEDALVFHIDDITHEYCPRYPSLESFPLSPRDLVGDYRMVARREGGSVGREIIGSALISIDDEVLGVSGAVGPVTIIDELTIIIQSGPFAGETMKIDLKTGVIIHQHVGYVPNVDGEIMIR